MKVNIEQVLDKLEELGYPATQEKNDRYRSVCPIHAGASNPSNFVIFDNDDGSIGFKCHGCDVDNAIVWELLNLGNDDYKEIIRKEFQSDDNVIKYPYTNRLGQVLYYKNRSIDKRFTFSHMWKNKEYNSKGNYSSILYNLPEVIKEDIILFTEGEKDADNLIKLGYTATTKDSTSRELNSSEIRTLKNKQLILFYDNDTAGKESLKRNIDAVGEVVTSLKVVHLDSRKKGYDISDYIEDNEATKKDIDKLIATAENIPVGEFRHLDLYTSYTNYITSIDKDKYEIKKEDGTITTNQNRVMQYLKRHIPIMNNNNQLYLYDNGVYKTVERGALESIVQDHLVGDYLNSTLRNGVVSLWQSDSTVRKDNLNDFKDMINVKNGMYNYKTKELKEHSYRYKSTNQINANYRTDITEEDGKEFIKFINHAVPNKDTQRLVQQILGYAISPLNQERKAFILYGPSATGKSKLLGALTNLVGQEHVSAVAWQNLGNRFSTATLYNKSLNVCADIPSTNLSQIDVFKSLVDSTDIVQAEFKGQDEFQFVNKAKLFFSANDLPEVEGKVGAEFYNRLILLPFNQVVNEEDWDLDLDEKLSNELDYILHWAIQGLDDYLENGFIYSNEVNELMSIYKSSKLKATLEVIKEMKEQNVILNGIHYYEYDRKPEIGLHTISIFKELQEYARVNLSNDERKGIYLRRSDFETALEQETYYIDTKRLSLNKSKYEAIKSRKHCMVVESNVI